MHATLYDVACICPSCPPPTLARCSYMTTARIFHTPFTLLLYLSDLLKTTRFTPLIRRTLLHALYLCVFLPYCTVEFGRSSARLREHVSCRVRSMHIYYLYSSFVHTRRMLECNHG